MVDPSGFTKITGINRTGPNQEITIGSIRSQSVDLIYRYKKIQVAVSGSYWICQV